MQYAKKKKKNSLQIPFFLISQLKISKRGTFFVINKNKIEIFILPNSTLSRNFPISHRTSDSSFLLREIISPRKAQQVKARFIELDKGVDRGIISLADRGTPLDSLMIGSSGSPADDRTRATSVALERERKIPGSLVGVCKQWRGIVYGISTCGLETTLVIRREQGAPQMSIRSKGRRRIFLREKTTRGTSR